MQSLFSNNVNFMPLADRMRPLNLAEYVGQEHLLGEGKILKLAIEQKQIPSMILWGPPGSGKTTLARILAEASGAEFLQMSAVTGGIKEIRDTVKLAEASRDLGKRTILFIDEIHRFNKSQQDAFLPYVENGTFILIGATTENPSFEVNSALLSRAKVFVLNALSVETIETVIRRALLDKERGLGARKLKINDEAISFLANMSNGDARVALNALELAATTGVSIKDALQKTHLLYDKGGEEHYNIISALHKSMRGNDADAALYWLGRMLEGGEDPLYIARRLIRFASEDIGLADPQALVQAVAAYQASHMLGMPECNVNLAQCVAYMARAPKSNALYMAYGAVKADIDEMPNEGVPLHLRNAPTKLMKNLDYGKGYKYTPEFKNAEEAKQDYLPKSLKGKKYLK
ncbi:MAG: replication-associated recombination protein A [bacterium]